MDKIRASDRRPGPVDLPPFNTTRYGVLNDGRPVVKPGGQVEEFSTWSEASALADALGGEPVALTGPFRPDEPPTRPELILSGT